MRATLPASTSDWVADIVQNNQSPLRCGLIDYRVTGRGALTMDVHMTSTLRLVLRQVQTCTLCLKQLGPCLDQQRHKVRVLEHELEQKP